MRTYGQYCPIARASEILAERWTPVILRNLLIGCRTYTEISAGAPGLSRSLLTQRLRHLERSGIVEIHPKPTGRGGTYQLTEAGRDLWDVIMALRTWGERWLEVGDEHTNPSLVLWAWCTIYLDRDRLPPGRIVVRFEFVDQPPGNRRRWIMVDRGDAEVCKHDPGFEDDVIVETDAKTFVRWHLKQIEWADAVRSGHIRVTGARWVAQVLPTWNRRGMPDEELRDRAIAEAPTAVG
ncbi:MAG: winged helix-turn-helix transcriptional regulator [Acidimicrobiales bacterium]